jgi:hypothetical protein
MSTTVKILTPVEYNVKVNVEGKFTIVVPTPTPVVVKVAGLFPSTFISKNIDGGLIY